MATKSLGVCAALLVLAAAPVVAAGAVNVNAASVFGAYAGADAYRLVVASDREGSGGFRAYSICPDGSRLSPLLSRGRPFERIVLSRDGSTVAYQTPPSTHGGIYISRADGSRFHTLALPAFPQAPVLSRDGRLLAFQDVGSTKLWIVGTDGRGLRQLASARSFDDVDWSPDAKAVGFVGALTARDLRNALTRSFCNPCTANRGCSITDN